MPSAYQAERAAAGAWVWMPHPTRGFEARRVVSPPAADGSFTGEAASASGGPGPGGPGSSGRRRIDAAEAKRGLPLDPNHLQRPPAHDLVMLPSVDEPMILHNLQKRFGGDEIYTSIGAILVSINPFKDLPLFTPAKIHEYSHARHARDGVLAEAHLATTGPLPSGCL